MKRSHRKKETFREEYDLRVRVRSRWRRLDDRVFFARADALRAVLTLGRSDVAIFSKPKGARSSGRIERSAKNLRPWTIRRVLVRMSAS